MSPQAEADQGLRPRRPQCVQAGQDRLSSFEGLSERLPTCRVESPERTLETADPDAVGDELGRDVDAGRFRKIGWNEADAGERVFEFRHLKTEKPGLQTALKAEVAFQAARHGFFVGDYPAGFRRSQVGGLHVTVAVGVDAVLLKPGAANDKVLVLMAEKIEGDIAPGHFPCAVEADNIGIENPLQEHGEVIKAALANLRGIVVESIRGLSWPAGTGLKADCMFRRTVLERNGYQTTDLIPGIFGDFEPRGRILDVVINEEATGFLDICVVRLVVADGESIQCDRVVPLASSIHDDILSLISSH